MNVIRLNSAKADIILIEGNGSYVPIAPGAALVIQLSAIMKNARPIEVFKTVLSLYHLLHINLRHGISISDISLQAFQVFFHIRSIFKMLVHLLFLTGT